MSLQIQKDVSTGVFVVCETSELLDINFVSAVLRFCVPALSFGFFAKTWPPVRQMFSDKVVDWVMELGDALGRC